MSNPEKKEPTIIMTATPDIERLGISLKADLPTDIFVKGGINYFETMFYLRYPSSAIGKRITVALKDANGQSIEQNIELIKGGTLSFEFNPSQDIGPNFGFLQLLSTEDLSLEIWSEVSNAGFM